MTRNTGPARLASMADVAAHAGVSVMTVSNVINRPDIVSARTTARVRASMSELNYRNNLVARSLRLAEPRQLGYLVSGRDRNEFQYMDEFLHQLAYACQRQHRNLTLVAGTDREADMDACENLYYGQSVAGFVLSNVAADDRRPHELSERGVPFVAYGQTAEGRDVPWSWVKTDGARGISLAVDHVASLGHSELAYIGYSEDKPFAVERREGYEAECERLGLISSTGPRRIRASEWGIAEGRAVAHELLDAQQPPTALVCVSDIIALGALTAVRERGLVPGSDVAITGFDDTPLALVESTGITSVRQPADLIAQSLVDLLIERPAVPRHELLEPGLVVRASTVVAD